MSKLDQPEDYLYSWWDRQDQSQRVWSDLDRTAGTTLGYIHPNDAILWYAIGGMLIALASAIPYIALGKLLHTNPLNLVCSYDTLSRTEKCFDPSKEEKDDNDKPGAQTDDKTCVMDKKALTYECADGYFCRYYQSRQKWRCNDARRRAEFDMLRPDGTKVCAY